MSTVQAVLLVSVAVVATVVVLQRDPWRQSVLVGVYGLLLAMLFFAFQAPDVALSQIVVGGVAAPLMLLVALRKLRDLSQDDDD